MIAMPFMNPDTTTLGIHVTNLPSRSTAIKTRMMPLKIITRLMKCSALAPGICERSLSCANATTTAVTVVMGPVGPEHWTLVPPSREVMNAMMAADIIPAKAPLPDKRPKAAPSVRATKLTVKPAIRFCTSSFLSIFFTTSTDPLTIPGSAVVTEISPPMSSGGSTAIKFGEKTAAAFDVAMLFVHTM